MALKKPARWDRQGSRCVLGLISERGLGAMFNVLPLLILLLLFAAALKVSFIFGVLYLVLGVYVLAVAWSRYALRGVKVEQVFEPYAMLGDRLDVQLKVRNSSLLPVPWLNVHQRLPLSLSVPPYFVRAVSLMPREEAVFAFTLPCRHRGYYPIGPISLMGGDPLGFEELLRSDEQLAFLTVYPRIVPLEELGLPSRSPFGHLSTKQRIYEDPARVIGVRDYHAGDSLRKVNWKVSARVGRLQVKKFEPAITLDTVLLLNLNDAEYDSRRVEYSVEMAITVAASIANHLALLRQQVGLVTNGSDAAERAETGGDVIGLPPRKGQGHLMRLLRLLARLERARGRRPFAQVVQDVARRLPWGATLVMITSTQTDDLLDTSFSLRQSGFNVVLVYVEQPRRGDSYARSQSMGFQTHCIWRDEDFNAWRRQQREVIA